MLRIEATASIPVDEPDADSGLITWLKVEIYECEDDDQELIGEASVALIHVGEALDLGEDLLTALDADSGELEALYHLYFEDGWLKEDLTNGSGTDLLYIADLEISPDYDGRNIELAVVRRLCNTLGRGCSLSVIPYESPAERQYWSQMGFVVSTPGEKEGWMHMIHGVRHPRILDPEGEGRFLVLPTEPRRARS